MDLTLICGTYGDEEWIRLAHERALPSMRAQGVPVIHVHGASLDDARNRALEQVQTEWVALVDADDAVDDGYVEALARGTADVRCPAIRQVFPPPFAGPTDPFIPRVFRHGHECTADCLRVGNWVVCGAATRTEWLCAVGGWDPGIPWSEDWAVWAKLWAWLGASFEPIPDAVYRAWWLPSSRNRSLSHREMLAAHAQIEDLVWGERVDPRTHPERADE